MTPALLEFGAILAIEIAAMHLPFRSIEGRWPMRTEVDGSRSFSEREFGPFAAIRVS